MEFTMNQSGGKVVVKLSGQLTFADAVQFDGVLGPLGKPGVSGVDFDLAKLDFVDSTGMSLFVHAYDTAEEKGFEITIRNAHDRVKTALDRAGFGNLVTLG